MLNRQEASSKIICALDTTLAESLALVELLEGRLRWVKVGMTLFYEEGPQIVRHFKERGLSVFLDLKLFDIPFQVEGAAAAAARTGADLISVHGLGGKEMLCSALRGVRSESACAKDRARVVAISVLTSMDAETVHSVGIPGAVPEEVTRLSLLAWKAGVDGVVTSPQEVATLRKQLGADALLITPGVRPVGTERGDQRRVATPGEAIARGASMVVIGRPLSAAENPKAAFDAITADIMAGSSGAA